VHCGRLRTVGRCINANNVSLFLFAGAQEWRDSAVGEFEKARVQLERGNWLTANQFLADVIDFDKVLCVCVLARLRDGYLMRHLSSSMFNRPISRRAGCGSGSQRKQQQRKKQQRRITKLIPGVNHLLIFHFPQSPPSASPLSLRGRSPAFASIYTGHGVRKGPAASGLRKLFGLSVRQERESARARESE